MDPTQLGHALGRHDPLLLHFRSRAPNLEHAPDGYRRSSRRPRDVLPIRPNDFHSIQSAFGVIIRRERTVNYLRSVYEDKAEFIPA